SKRHCPTGCGYWTPICVCVAPEGLTGRRGNITTRVRTISRSRIGVSTRSATTINLYVQACPHSGYCLRLPVEKYATAVPPAHCRGVGSPVPSNGCPATRTAGAALYGSRVHCTGGWLLASSGSTSH